MSNWEFPVGALNTRTCQTKHGKFTYHSNDRFLGASLRIYGEYSEGEVDFYDVALKPTDFAVEVGANIGALTIPLARKVRGVLAFEPQPESFKLLEKNLDDNEITNVGTHRLALGSKTSQDTIPSVFEMDAADQWGQIGNYGIAQLGHGSYVVNVRTLDSVLMPNLKVDFMKLDCEGSELEVLKGAEKTITRDWPLLYVENDRPDKSGELIRWLNLYGYDCFWHKPMLFNPQNYNRHQENIFGDSKSKNMICIKAHHELRLDRNWLRDPA